MTDSETQGGAISPPPGPATALSGRGAAVTVVAQSIARAITLFVVLGSTAIVTRHVGVPIYANWVTALSLMALAGFLLDPGITPVVVRRLVQDPAAAPRPSAVLAVRLALAVPAVGLVVVLSLILRGGDSVALALVLGAQLIPRASVINVGAWLQADQRLYRQTILEAIVATLGLTGLAIAAASDAPVVALAAIGFLAPALLLAVAMVRELRLTPSAHLAPPGPQAERVRSLLHEVAPLAASLVFVTVYTRVDVVFVNAAVEAAQVAQYLFAFQFVEQLIVLAGIISAAVLPLMAGRALQVTPFEDGPTHDMLAGLAAIGALVSLVLILFAQPLVRLIAPALARASESLVLLAPMGVVLLVAVPLGAVYLALGRGRSYLRLNAFALLVNVGGNAALTLPFGIGAAARLTWVTELAVAALASRPLFEAGEAGRRCGLRLAALIGVVVVCSEAVAAGVPNAAAAIPAAAIVIVLAGPQLRWLAEVALRRRTVALAPSER